MGREPRREPPIAVAGRRLGDRSLTRRDVALEAGLDGPGAACATPRTPQRPSSRCGCTTESSQRRRGHGAEAMAIASASPRPTSLSERLWSHESPGRSRSRWTPSSRHRPEHIEVLEGRRRNPSWLNEVVPRHFERAGHSPEELEAFTKLLAGTALRDTNALAAGERGCELDPVANGRALRRELFATSVERIRTEGPRLPLVPVELHPHESAQRMAVPLEPRLKLATGRGFSGRRADCGKERGCFGGEGRRHGSSLGQRTGSVTAPDAGVHTSLPKEYTDQCGPNAPTRPVRTWKPGYHGPARSHGPRPAPRRTTDRRFAPLSLRQALPVAWESQASISAASFRANDCNSRDTVQHDSATRRRVALRNSRRGSGRTTRSHEVPWLHRSWLDGGSG